LLRLSAQVSERGGDAQEDFAAGITLSAISETLHNPAQDEITRRVTRGTGDQPPQFALSLRASPLRRPWKGANRRRRGPRMPLVERTAL